MNIIWKLRKYLRMFAGQYIVAIIALQIVALLNLVPFWLIGQVVNQINEGKLNADFLAMHVVGILLSAIAMYALRYVWQNKLYGAAISISKELRKDLFYKFSTLSPAFYSRRSTGDLMAHATNDLNAIEETTGMGIMTLIDSLIAGLTIIFGMIFVVSGELTAVALLPFPLLIFITRKYGIKLHKAFARSQEAFSSLNEEARETVSGIRAVHSHGIKSRQERRFSKSLDEALTANFSVAKIDAAFAPTIQLVYGLSFVMAIGYGAWLVDEGTLSVGLFTTFTLYLTQLLGPFMQFGWQFNVFQRGNTSWARLQTILTEQEEIKEGSVTLPINVRPNLSVDISSFAYSGENTQVLNDIKFNLPAHGMVGITGPIGGGKSTLLQLITRQFEAQNESTININGYSIKDITFKSLRGYIAWVPQKPFLFSGTIADNIALGKPNANHEEIRFVAEVAAIAEEIEAMPNGFNTILTEGGSNLSGGQKQRLTLARALLTGAEILLLDDPFSALDMHIEIIVRQNLNKHFSDKTILLVTQRLPNLIDANHIIVLEDGHITEQGNHTELVSEKGWYAKVYKKQSQLNNLLPLEKKPPTIEPSQLKVSGDQNV
ncbi:ABC transporter ATP-binding protein [Pseudoalteromonas distincta]|uniref:ABC transporter ATP-binding protein n=1 Tax=Pseudoalteromonas distincta TaxID=77608 RepID=UPI0039E8DF68